MKKIAIVTATRAEYGLLKPVIIELRKNENKEVKIDLVVTGTHLSERHGSTIKEIEADSIRIDKTIPISVNNDSEVDIAENQADALIKFTRLFSKERYNAVVLLGDRYELLAIAIAAGNTKTPIFHLCGGDTTEGAIDEWIRHSITKISYLHFVTNDESRRRVIQLGEAPDRVFNYGSTSIDNIMSIEEISKKEALKSIGLPECRYALCTYHPVTTELEAPDKKVSELIRAMKAFPDIVFIITKANADQSGNRINKIFDQEAKDSDNLYVFASLGAYKYLSLMKHAEFVLGNSSSGIVEAPALKVATINIGDRQRGRLQSESIINCTEDARSIKEAIELAISDEHKNICKKIVSPYGVGNSGKKIANKILFTIQNKNIELKKSFYNIYDSGKEQKSNAKKDHCDSV